MRRFIALTPALAACLAASSGAAVAAAARPVIRAGGPSAPSESKVAIVAGDRSLAGRRFTVREGRRIVLRGRLRRAPGRTAPWRHAYRADLSAVRKPGSYRVMRSTSPAAGWTPAT